MCRDVVVDVVEAITDAKGIGLHELEPPLQEHIDTEAIQLLAAHETASWTLSFELPAHTVTVASDGVVLVDGVREIVWV